MTLLIGTVVGSGTPTFANGQTGTRMYVRDYVASATGSLETISFLVDGDADNLVFLVYSAAGALLGSTGIAPSGNGVITGTLTSAVPVVSGTTYKLCVYFTGSYFYFLTDGVSPAKIYDGGTYSSPSASMTTTDDGGVQQLQLWGDGTVGGGDTLDTITNPLTLGGSGSITTTGLGSLTSLTIGGKQVSSLSAASGDGTFSIPLWVEGVQGFLLGSSQAVSAGDGTKTVSSTTTINPQAGYTLVTLTSVNSGSAYLGNQVSLSIGDQIIFPTAASLGAATNYIDVDGGIFTSYAGSQTLYKRNVTTGIVTQITLINGQVAPSKMALLWLFGM